MPNIRVVHVCEGDYPSERWMGLRGRLTRPRSRRSPGPVERMTFTCGPPAYMDAVRRILGESAYDLTNYHEESFSFENLAEAGRAAADP